MAQRATENDGEPPDDARSTTGAIDNDWDEAERSAEEVLQKGVADLPTEPAVGGVAFDLVTRQPVYILGIAAETVVEYYEREGFDLLGYKTHPYLPVRADDTVYECCYIGELDQVHRPSKRYEIPRGRLLTVPVELAGETNE